MKRIMDPQQFKSWLAFLLLATAIIIIFHLVSQAEIIFGWMSAFFSIIAPFIAGFMIAYALNIPRERVEKLLEKWVKKGWILKRKRGISILATYAGLIGVLFLFGSLFLPHIYASITDFINFVPELVETIVDFFVELDADEAVPFFSFEQIADNLSDHLSVEEIMRVMSQFDLTGAVNTIMSFFSFIFRFALAIISSVYFMAEGDGVRNFAKRTIKALMHPKLYEPIVKYGREVNAYFKRYIFCQVTDAIILGTIMTIALSIIRADFAFVLGPMLGFANLIPYFGSIIGTIAAFVVIMVTDGPRLAVIAGIMMLVIQQFDANFIFPRLIGGSMKISPLLVIIGISVGGAYFGIVGMIIAIPIVTVVRNIVDDIVMFYEGKKTKKQETTIIITED